jgi:cell wall-associated NlpC family hydrolase
MFKRNASGRRAANVSTNPLKSISQAVASNAGSVGRQAAVIAAAGGLVLTLGVATQTPTAASEAAPATQAAPVTETLQAERASVQSVAVAADKKYEVERAALKSAPAPKPKPKPEPQPKPAVVKTAASSSTSSDAAGAAMTSATRASASSSVSTARSTAVKPVAKKVVAKKPAAKPAASTGSAKGQSIANMALSYKGTPYVWGGSTPAGWDCSGFVQYIYGKHGVSLPHNTTAIRTSGKFVKTSSPKPGDLVYQNGGGHVGIYIGGGKIIGAQNPSVGTVIREADSPYGPLMGYYTLKK